MAHTGKRLTATGQVSTGPTTLYGVSGVFTAAGIVTLRDTDGSGTVKATFDAPASGFAISIPYAMEFPGGLHATMTGTPVGVTFWL